MSLKLNKEIVNKIEVSDWNKFIMETYKRPYDFQQQDGCKERGVFSFNIPEDCTLEYDTTGEHHDMGVTLKDWLERDPKEPIKNQKYDWELETFWERVFYPDIYALLYDLRSKGLIEDGNYLINIDW